MDIFEAPLARIQKKMKEHLSSPIPLLQELVDYGFNKSGKNIRSKLMIALCFDHALIDFEEKFEKIAATIELIHAATLFHDDVIDASPERRSHPSVPIAFSNTCSILLGDYCFSKSYMLLKDVPEKDILFEKISQTAQDLIAGEVLQYQMKQQHMSLEQYFHIIELKTARLFELVTSSLCVVQPDIFEQQLCLFGRKVGIFFQVLDDYFDYFREQGLSHSKAAGKDFEEKKMTFPVLIALAQNIIPSADLFWDKNSTFDEFVGKIQGAQLLCSDWIQRYYEELLIDIERWPLTKNVLDECIISFMGKKPAFIRDVQAFYS